MIWTAARVGEHFLQIHKLLLLPWFLSLLLIQEKATQTTWTYLKYVFCGVQGGPFCVVSIVACAEDWMPPYCATRCQGTKFGGVGILNPPKKITVEKNRPFVVSHQKKVTSPRISKKKQVIQRLLLSIYLPFAFVCFWSFFQVPKSVSVCRRSRCISFRSQSHCFQMIFFVTSKDQGSRRGQKVTMCVYVSLYIYIV